ncbi:transposase [Stigmatella aurantiaca]|nr:transposase [Stigmatella aurantiaca]
MGPPCRRNHRHPGTQSVISGRFSARADSTGSAQGQSSRALPGGAGFAGAGRRLRAAGGRRALRAVASAYASRGGATAAGGGGRHRVLRLLEKRGALPAQGPEDALQAYPAHSLQQRLRWTEVDVRLPPRKQPRCAFLEGFSLHAHTRLHANDRQGLERRCRYGARGALAQERLSREEDGRIAYRMKRPLPDGTAHLLFTGLTLLRWLASLVPPPRANLTRFHGVFAPGAKVRPVLLPQTGAEPGLEEESPAFAATVEEPRKERTPRLDWAGLLKRTFALDVFACLRCGGRLRAPNKSKDWSPSSRGNAPRKGLLLGALKRHPFQDVESMRPEARTRAVATC